MVKEHLFYIYFFYTFIYFNKLYIYNNIKCERSLLKIIKYGYERNTEKMTMINVF